ncbi:MAG TPA: rhodanese-like domain-containing protein [Burkholderiales bacterium]|nr:rhodanese-like domain-containing protein [Burkholderiales bacterium]
MTPEALRAALLSRDELALLDVREQGVHYRGHPFFACSLPLSRLETRVADLVPRKDAPMVLLDGGGEGLAERAQRRLEELGYTRVDLLDGGCAAWKASGGELFSGVNVPSKAFGEFVEHHYGTPRVPPAELKRLVESGRRLVILDSRPWEEYHRMNIPGGIDVPGAELVYRTPDLAPDAETLVVVNCAGRTRSIIGCQSLRNAGWKDVVALKDGTMGWELAGLECERGSARVAAPPGPAGRDRARAAAAQVAERFQVKFARHGDVRAWLAEPARTTYLLDVRSREEYEAGHLEGARHAPGGQLVQATDEYVGVRNARVVLVDPERVRSVMTASWLNQMGWEHVHVLEPDAGDWPTERGARVMDVPGFERWATLGAQELARGRCTVLDLSTSLRYRARHVPGAWWGVRSRLAEARVKMADASELVLTSEDGLLAHLAAPEAAALWPHARVQVLEGGNRAWFAENLPSESGFTRLTTANDDVWYKPYDHEHESDYEKHARAYLDWEVALVDQIKRDPAIRFRAYD